MILRLFPRKLRSQSYFPSHSPDLSVNHTSDPSTAQQSIRPKGKIPSSGFPKKIIFRFSYWYRCSALILFIAITLGCFMEKSLPILAIILYFILLIALLYHEIWIFQVQNHQIYYYRFWPFIRKKWAMNKLQSIDIFEKMISPPLVKNKKPLIFVQISLQMDGKTYVLDRSRRYWASQVLKKDAQDLAHLTQVPIRWLSS